MTSSVQVAPVAIIIFALGVAMVFSLRASGKGLTWTELVMVGGFAILIGSLAGHGLADSVNGALTNAFRAFGH